MVALLLNTKSPCTPYPVRPLAVMPPSVLTGYTTDDWLPFTSCTVKALAVALVAVLPVLLAPAVLLAEVALKYKTAPALPAGNATSSLQQRLQPVGEHGQHEQETCME